MNSKVGAIHTQSLTADAVEINTNTGSIHVDQVTATQDVTLNSNVGAVEINNVSANSLVVNSRTGSITFSKAQISNQVSLTNSTGSIKGWFQGYSSLNTVNGTGSAKMTLIPGSTTSKTSIKTELGSIDAIVKGFHGRFSANTDLGKVYVSGGENGEFGQDKSSLSGVVGEDVGALMDFKTGTGKVQISFLPELNPKEQ
ncbi:hypothetical protein BCR33DRAFT_791466 [Rhizoclosmatium globosum]|uniref:DUF4097 domain-containing protein n=1 Tax=Rhizoclosmatium globosum TaxID=329046 RepID=A0A1Y2BEH2_9FUNG|nr:hypothetical protein BCR33DRAFT_791466 [Rhizoclosmatium globosum]|eukprot:ORY33239.1 hypothetical protein BCR33DRAFT_791466 [Rhizoclosmatium globosum]